MDTPITAISDIIQITEAPLETKRCSLTCQNAIKPYCHCLDCTTDAGPFNDEGLCVVCAGKCVICYFTDRWVDEKGVCLECSFAFPAECAEDCANIHIKPYCHCIGCGLREPFDPNDADTCKLCLIKFALIGWAEAINPPKPMASWLDPSDLISAPEMPGIDTIGSSPVLPTTEQVFSP
jgi:hypothetical protein